MNTERDRLLDEVVTTYLKDVEAGRAPDRGELLARHPELAADLAEFFAAESQVNRAAAPLRADAHTPTVGMHRSASSGPGTRVEYVGDYHLLAEVGRGGMGVVYKASQETLRRTVALKMILSGQLATEADVRRFRAEAEAAARLDHPGIVTVYEVGQHEGQHFFSMGYVDGPNLAQVLADGPLPARDGATIVKLVAEAISFAHDRGVIHRDLKPANVLLAKLDGSGKLQLEGVSLRAGTSGAASGGYFQPKVTDFGLAKKTAADEGGLTGTGQILGTPSYMPPEQASGRNSDVGAVSDVYSLGAILYAALTGHPPFQSDTPLNVVRQVLEQEPVSPRQSNPAVPRDLETICLKCLEKDRRKRYASARELAEELQRYLSGEPIRARRISSLERGWRWCRRKPTVAALWALGAAVLLTLSIVGPWLAYKEHEVAQRESLLRKQAEFAQGQAKEERNTAQEQREIATEEKERAQRQEAIATQEKERAQRQEEIASQERDRAQRNLAAGQLTLGKSSLQNNRTAEALNWFLHAYLNAPQDDPMRTGARNLIGANLNEIPQTLVHPATVHEVAVSPDGKTLWAAYLSSQSQMWDLTTGNPIGKPMRHSGDVVSGAFSPDGASLITGDWDGATVWNAANGQRLYPKLAHENREDTMIAPEFSPDGTTIATRDTLESIRLWDAKSGKPRCKTLPHQGEIWRIRFSPDSQWVAAQSGDEVRVWKGTTGEMVGTPWASVSDFAFLPDGKLIAICAKDGKVSLRNVADASTVVELEHDEPISTLQFDAAGKSLLGYFVSHQASPSHAAVVWQNVAGEGRSKVSLRKGLGLGFAAISPNGALVALVESGHVRVVQTRDGKSLWTRNPPASSARGSAGSFEALEFSSDSQRLLVRGKSVAFVLSVNQERLLAQEENLRCSAFSPDGKRVVFGGEFGWARVRSVETVASRPVAVLEDTKKTRGIQNTAFTSDGRIVVTSGRGQQVQFWDAETWQQSGEPINLEFPVVYLALSPDDKRIALMLTLPKPPMAALFDPTPARFELWDVSSRKRIGEPLNFPGGAWQIAFDATGKTIAISNALYDAETLQPRPAPPDNGDQAQAVVKLLWRNSSRSPKLWDETANSPTRVQLPAKGLQYPRITPQGRLIAQNQQGQIRLWEAATGQPLGPLFPIDGAPVFSSDSGRYIVGGQHDAVQIWDTVTGKRCGEQLPGCHVQMAAAFNPEESVLATYEWFETRMWDCATGIMLGPSLQNTSTGENDLDFSPDGRWLLSTDGRVNVFRVPQPAINDPPRLRLLVETRTGLRVDENGTLQILRHNEWRERKKQLDEISPDAN